MKGKFEVTHRRYGMRGGAAVDRVERFPSEYLVKGDAMCISWRASNGQQNEVNFPLPSELIKPVEPPGGDGSSHATRD